MYQSVCIIWKKKMEGCIPCLILIISLTKHSRSVIMPNSKVITRASQATVQYKTTSI